MKKTILTTMTIAAAVAALAQNAPSSKEKEIEAKKAKAKAAQPARAMREDYKIGAGDQIDVRVWKEEEMSAIGVMVRADGKVSLPFLKEVQAAGFTPSELEARLKEGFTKFVQDPEVSVLIRQVTSEKIYVMGQVRKPGPLVMTTPLTVLQAIAESGGPTEYAKKKKMYVLRKGTEKIPFNYEGILKGEAMDQNIVLLPGDTIVVP